MAHVTHLPNRVEHWLLSLTVKLILALAITGSIFVYIIFVRALSDQNGWSIMAALYCLIPFVILYVWHVLIHHLYKIHSYFDGWQNWDFPWNKDDRERAKTIAMLRTRSFFVVFVIGVCLVLVLPLSKTVPSGAIRIDKSGMVYSAGSQAKIGKLSATSYLIPLQVHAHPQHTQEFHTIEMTATYGVTLTLEEAEFVEFSKTKDFHDMRVFRKASQHDWGRYQTFMEAFDIDSFIDMSFKDVFNAIDGDVYHLSDEGLMLELGLVIQSRKDELPPGIADIKIDSMIIKSISTKN